MKSESDRHKLATEKEYMEILRPCIHLHGIQIKSIGAFKKLAFHVEEIEGTVGIHSTTISLEDIFVCPDIVWEDLVCMTPMEKLLLSLITELSEE